MSRAPDLSWRLDPLTRFDDVRRDWERLATRLGVPPILDAPFAETLIDVFRPEATYIGRLDVNGEICGVAILSRKSPYAWVTYKPPNAPLGLWLLDPELPLESALRTLIRCLPGWPLILSLHSLDPEIVPPTLTARTATIAYIDTARISIDQSFDDWLMSTSKNLRHTLQRQRRRLAELGIAVETRRIVAPGEIESAMKIFARLENEGWKGRSGSAVAPESDQERFYTRMLVALTARGEAEIWQILYDGAVAACDLCVRRGGVTIILKTTFSEALAANKTSPAQLLRSDMFRDLFARDPGGKIEFFGRLMAWHQRWTQERRTLYHLNHYRWGCISWLHRQVQARRPTRQPSNASNSPIDVSQE